MLYAFSVTLLASLMTEKTTSRNLEKLNGSLHTSMDVVYYLAC